VETEKFVEGSLENVLNQTKEMGFGRFDIMSVLHLNSENFEAETAKGIVLVDFWAEWCGPCRMLGPIFEELSGEIEQAKFAKVDITENEELAQKFGVMSIPTIILLKDGKEEDRMMGVVPKEALRKWVESKL